MAVSTGTATNYLDLLDKLRTFAVANGWTSLRYTTGETGPAEQQLIMKGSGLGGTDEIFVGIDTERDEGQDWYNFRLAGYLGYDAGQPFDNQPGGLQTSAAHNYPRMHLWNDAIQYWFVLNGRRIIIVAKVSTVYQLGYLGFINPYLPPSMMPYPMMIAGTSTHNQRWSVSDISHSFGLMQPFCLSSSTTESVILSNPRTPCRLWSGEWHGIQHYRNTTTSPSGTDWKALWPYCRYQDLIFQDNIAHPTDGSYTLYPIVPHFRLPSQQVFGEIDGVHYVTGFGQASEDIITINLEDYLVVQNVYRTGRFDYCAVKLV